MLGEIFQRSLAGGVASLQMLVAFLQQKPGRSPLFDLVPIVAIFVIFWFLLIAPTRRRQRELQQTIEALKKGDKVLTSGGLHGDVVAVEDRVVILRIADSVKVRVEKSAITGLAGESGDKK